MNAGTFFSKPKFLRRKQYIFHGKLYHATIQNLLEDFADRTYKYYCPVDLWKYFNAFFGNLNNIQIDVGENNFFSRVPKKLREGTFLCLGVLARAC